MNISQFVPRTSHIAGNGWQPPGRVRPKFRGRPIPAKTGPLDLLSARNLVVVADVENLTFSARNAGFKLSYAALGALLAKTGSTLQLHACFCREANREAWEDYFEERGWMPHTRMIDYIMTRRGVEKLANADVLIAFQCGRLIAETDGDVLIATGDGTLANDIAHSTAESWPDRLIFTLGFPGAVSSRLKPNMNNGIAGNLLVGMDCLRPISRKPRAILAKSNGYYS
jgi:hypothetical protein